ncbi:MAG: DedA family protein [Bacteroidota bacterium]|nr:DedA family protein [Bacteroidota bacterium]
METLNFWITHYGYAGIFSLLLLGIVGLPVPDETLIALTGFLVYKGELTLLPAFFSAFLGSCAGITVSYFIGRGFGKFILEKYGRFIHLDNEKLDRAHNWFNRVGRWALIFGYFIPGVRHIISIFAGSSRLEYPEFALFTYTGGFIWISTFLSLGYFFGEKWQIILKNIHNHIIISSSVIIIAIILIVYLKTNFSKKKKSISEDLIKK